MEQIAKTTLQTIMPSGDKVEIGDKNSLDFKPHLKLNRWGGECFIKVGLPVTEKSLPIIDGDKITWEGKDRHIIMYPLAPDKQMELGGYEYEVVLDKKPKTNKIIIDLQGQGLRFGYQPALTQQEIEEGCIRPENVVGSYVVKHATKGGMNSIYGKDYKAGIYGMIYRPKIVDARGDWVWGEQIIANDKQIITIPQEFLEYAHYPIRHVGGDTFGYTEVGASQVGAGNNAIFGYVYTGGAGTGVSMSVRVADSGSKFELALYLDSDDSLVDSTVEGTAPAVHDWITVNFNGSPALSAVVYKLCHNFEVNIAIRYNTVSSYTYYHDPQTYGTWPSTAVFNTYSQTYEYSLYCTYTPSVAGWAGGDVNGVAIAAIAKINGIALADITKVNGIS